MFEFFIFAFVTAITPGPNNSLLMASGIKFGRKASIPHFLGIWLGFIDHTNEHIIRTSRGIVKCRAIKKKDENEKFA